MRSAKRCLELFRRLGYDDRKIKLVLNRYQRSSKITAEVIAEAVGLPVAHTLSNDFASAIESINRGLMLDDVAPRSPLTRDIEALAPLLAGETTAAERARLLARPLVEKGRTMGLLERLKSSTEAVDRGRQRRRRPELPAGRRPRRTTPSRASCTSS